VIPDCILFSCGRAGSTSLYFYLDQIAKLDLPKNKEPHFWLGDLSRWKNVPKVLESIKVAETAEYEALYTGSRKSIDASVAYYHNVDVVIDRLGQANVRPKAVVLVREPVQWAKSLHVENMYQGLENERDLEVCMSEDRSDPAIWWQLRYTSVRYAEVYEQIRSAFSDVLLIDHSTFESQPDLVFDRLCRFLDVEPLSTAPTVRHHTRKGRLDRLQLGPYYRFWKRLPSGLRSQLLTFLQRRGQDFPIVNDSAKIVPYLGESIESYAKLHDLYQEDFIG